MVFLYDLIFFLIFLFFLPVYLVKGKLHSGFLCRLGIMPKGIVFNSPIWIHTVSVGEAMAVKEFVSGLRGRYPGVQMVFSTVTPTGNQVARSFAQPQDAVIYLPFDFSLVVRSVLRRMRPRLFLAAETEFWPNLLSALRAYGVPAAVINGRISDRSLRGYARLKVLFAPLLRKIGFFCVQTEKDAERLVSLGVENDRIKVTGNLKFDAGISSVSAAAADACRLTLGLGEEERLLVAGSTHEGEEELVLRAYEMTAAGRRHVRLLLAPRHPRRAAEVAALLRARGLHPVMVSGLEKGGGDGRADSEAVFILDSVGRLFDYYGAAYAVFVGGSLVPRGGHNIIEPASWSKPVLCGPYTFNFREIISIFSRDDACINVGGTGQLAQAWAELLDHPGRAAEAGRKARGVIDRHRGAGLRTLAAVALLVNGKGI
jgi:3-deoxy-D-manno-octulosonic-acid transferase